MVEVRRGEVRSSPHPVSCSCSQGREEGCSWMVGASQFSLHLAWRGEVEEAGCTCTEAGEEVRVWRSTGAHSSSQVAGCRWGRRRRRRSVPHRTRCTEERQVVRREGREGEAERRCTTPTSPTSTASAGYLALRLQGRERVEESREERREERWAAGHVTWGEGEGEGEEVKSGVGGVTLVACSTPL